MTDAIVKHPLEYLDEIDLRQAQTQEALLRESPNPWAEMLVEYVDQLAALVDDGPYTEGPEELCGIEDGHAGGCG